MKLDNRLAACAAFVRPGVTAADIGTDHAHLPIWLVQNGVCPRVIACDLHEGPLARARQAVAAAGLAGQIELRLADGLCALAPYEADDIILAGMGAELIIDILRAAPWIKNPATRLILQPMIYEEKLRAFLCQNGFAVLAEQAVAAGKFCYTVMHCAYVGQPIPLDDLFLLCGKIPGQSTPQAKQYLRKRQRQLRAKIDGLRRSGQDTSPLEKLALKLNHIMEGVSL